VPALLDPEITAEIVYESPLAAPVTAGDIVGELIVRQGVRDQTVTVPIVAVEDVARGGMMVRLRTATNMLLEEVLGGDEAAEAAPAADG
jgi:D-alanyl-D-alanine carboxypeptidase (penicillin-binding protein 5/6)